MPESPDDEFNTSLDPQSVAAGFHALRGFLEEVVAEPDCDEVIQRLATLALAWFPAPEALDWHLAGASALQLHVWLHGLHWGRCVLDAAQFDCVRNRRLAARGQALHALVMSRDALPLLPVLPWEGRRWRAIVLGVEGLVVAGTQMPSRSGATHGPARSSVTRLLGVLRQGHELLLTLAREPRRGAYQRPWQEAIESLLHAYPRRETWSRRQMWAQSESALHGVHQAVESLRHVMDAAQHGLLSVSDSTRRSMRRLLKHWPSAESLADEAQRCEAPERWLHRRIGPAPRRMEGRSRRAMPGVASAGMRRVTLAYARRNFRPLMLEVQNGTRVFIKDRRRGTGGWVWWERV